MPNVGKDASAVLSRSLVASLVSCARKKDLQQGIRLHDDIVRRGLLQTNIFIGNAIISMYAKCGAIAKAHRVLDHLPVRDVVSWSALISGYVHMGLGEHALNCYEDMQSEGLFPDATTYACILTACGMTRSLDKAEMIHSEVVSHGLPGTNVVLGNTLVGMYAKCGALTKARQLIDELVVRDVISWSTLIAGYAQSGLGYEALNCYEVMHCENLHPDASTYTCILKACAITGELELGKQIHLEIINQGLLKQNVVLGTALIDMYAKFGDLSKAREVLNDLPSRDIVAWSALIAGYVQKGHSKEALDLYEQIWSEGLSPDAITYACILHACGNTKELDRGKQIHDEMASQGLLGQNVVLTTALIDMYVKCGCLTKAREVIDELPTTCVAPWNALIAEYCQRGKIEEAMACLESMQHQGLSPDPITYICILKACAMTKFVCMGTQIHDEIVSQQLMENGVLGAALVDMYAKCGLLAKAQDVLDALPTRDVVSWSALIAGYAQNGQGMEALNCFEKMRSEGLSPDAITYASVLKACGTAQEVERGKQIHDEISTHGLLGKDIVLGNALVDMYARCAVMSKAQQVIDELLDRDIVTWNALMAGYARQGQLEEAMESFERMQRDGFSPDASTYASLLKACSIMREAHRGKQIHDEIVSHGMLADNVMLGNALVDMYCKCGSLSQAQGLVNECLVREVVSWNALLAGYALQGQVEEAMDCFQRMQSNGFTPDVVSWNALVSGHAQQGQANGAMDCLQQMQCEDISPNATTFVYVLNACSHSGLVDQGQLCIGIMRSFYEIMLDIEHHICMIDLFGRAGQFGKAMTVIQEMPSSNYLQAWSSLLSACQKWGNDKLGRWAFEHAKQLDEWCPATYVCMANIHVAAYIQQGVAKNEL